MSAGSYRSRRGKNVRKVFAKKLKEFQRRCTE
jgi:hypothetical protein